MVNAEHLERHLTRVKGASTQKARGTTGVTGGLFGLWVAQTETHSSYLESNYLGLVARIPGLEARPETPKRPKETAGGNGYLFLLSDSPGCHMIP